MRILVLNNYSLQYAVHSWSKGLAGRHHLWGASEFAGHGHEVEYLPYRRWPWLNRLVGNSWRVGDLDQEVRAAFERRYDVVYAAAGDAVMGLALLRALRGFGRPIVSIMHQFPPFGRYSRLCLRGMDRIACLNSSLAKGLCENYPECRTKIRITEWGWDLDFPQPCEEHGEYVFSVGMSVRDYDTFCQALREMPLPAKIVCTRNCAPRGPVGNGTEVRVVDPNVRWIYESELRPYYTRALAVAVPLQRVAQSVTAGISSILEAMANSRAVLVTRTPSLDIDIEKEGCGIWVEPGDVAGWVCALRYVAENPQAAREMGRRGRQLCETRYNIERFGGQMVRLVEEVTGLQANGSEVAH
jgi:glycosyltransferase involved in cell wall biosynthesis